MNDPLHQININYSSNEDRLLLRITTRQGDEFRAWLTRRFTAVLMDVLGKEIDRRGGLPAVASRPETRRMFREGVLEKPFEEEASRRFPLGETGFLASRIGTRDQPGNSLSLELRPETGQGVTLNLDQSLLFMLYNLLTQGVGRADWHLPEPQSVNEHIH